MVQSAGAMQDALDEPSGALWVSFYSPHGSEGDDTVHAALGEHVCTIITVQRRNTHYITPKYARLDQPNTTYSTLPDHTNPHHTTPYSISLNYYTTLHDYKTTPHHHTTWYYITPIIQR